MANGCPSSSRWRRPQGRGGTMIWALIINGIMVRPLRVSEGIQITAETYIAILKELLEPWFKRQRINTGGRWCSCKIIRISFNKEDKWVSSTARLLCISPYEVACVFSGFESNWKYMKCLEEASLSGWTPIFVQRCIVEAILDVARVIIAEHRCVTLHGRFSSKKI